MSILWAFIITAGILLDAVMIAWVAVAAAHERPAEDTRDDQP